MLLLPCVNPSTRATRNTATPGRGVVGGRSVPQKRGRPHRVCLTRASSRADNDTPFTKVERTAVKSTRRTRGTATLWAGRRYPKAFGGSCSDKAACGGETYNGIGTDRAMGIIWQHLSGNTATFAIQVALEHDPDGGIGCAPEESASWGSFKIWVKGANICEHTELGERVESVHWYLFPLFEWLVDHWNPLFHEERFPLAGHAVSGWSALRETRFPPRSYVAGESRKWEQDWYQWWKRHALRGARAGGLFPDLVIRRWRGKVELSIGSSPLPGVPEDFRFVVSEGHYRFDPLEVARPVHAVVCAAVEQMMITAPGSPRLASLRNRLRRVPTQAQKEEKLAWLVGLGGRKRQAMKAYRAFIADISDVADDAATRLFGEPNGLLVVPGSCHAGLMFGSVSPMISEEDVRTLGRLLLGLHEDERPECPLDDHVESVEIGPTKEDAWQGGYELADELTNAIGLTTEGEDLRVDIKSILGDLAVTVSTIELTDQGIRAVSVAGPHHPPTILVNTRCEMTSRSETYRFTLAHELCHLLHDRSQGAMLAVASGPWAPGDLERRANAFAAMFLMPVDNVRAASRRSESDPGSSKWLIDVAGMLGTSLTATLEHAYNIGAIDDTDRQRLRWKVNRTISG